MARGSPRSPDVLQRPDVNLDAVPLAGGKGLGHDLV